MPKITRRAALRVAAGLQAGALIGAPRLARAAEFALKYGNNLPRDASAATCARRRRSSASPARRNGPRRDQDLPEQPARRRHRHAGPGALRRHRLLHALGAGDRDAGAGGRHQRRRLRLLRLRPGLGAMDGKLGAHVRAAIAKSRLYAFEKMWDNGFRQMTTSSKRRSPARQGHGRPEDPRAGEPAVDLDVQGPGRRRRPACSSARCTRRCRPRSSTRRRTRCRSSRSPSSTRCRSSARSPTTSGTATGSSPTAAPGRRCRPTCKTIVASAINEAGLKQREDIKKLNEIGAWPTCESKGLAFNRPDARQLPRQAARGRLLRRVEGPLRRRGLGPARKRRRQAGLSGVERWPRTPPSPDAAPLPERRRSARLAVGVDRAARRAWSRALAAALVLAEIVVLFAGVVARYVFHAPLVWSDELASILFLWLSMLGAVVALRRGEHMRMTALVDQRRPARARAAGGAGASPPRSPSWCWCCGRPTNTRTRRPSSSRRRWRSATPGAPRPFRSGIALMIVGRRCCGCCASASSRQIAIALALPTAAGRSRPSGWPARCSRRWASSTWSSSSSAWWR